MHHHNQKSQRKSKFGNVKKRLVRQKAQLESAEDRINIVKLYGENYGSRKRSGDEDV